MLDINIFTFLRYVTDHFANNLAHLVICCLHMDGWLLLLLLLLLLRLLLLLLLLDWLLLNLLGLLCWRIWRYNQSVALHVFQFGAAFWHVGVNLFYFIVDFGLIIFTTRVSALIVRGG